MMMATSQIPVVRRLGREKLTSGKIQLRDADQTPSARTLRARHICILQNDPEIVTPFVPYQKSGCLHPMIFEFC
jgi:hypothetical protein